MDTVTSLTKYIKVSNNGKTITSQCDGAGNFNAYGQTAIISSTKNIYTWTFTCTKRQGSVIIGIISTRDINGKWQAIDYGYDGADGRKYKKGKSKKYGKAWNAGDKIEMKVDFSKQEISFIVNDSDQGVAYNNIKIGDNITYYLVVSTGTWGSANRGDSITINAFINNNNASGSNEKKENDMFPSILDENEMLQKENEQLRADVKLLKTENDKLRQRNNSLLDDKKEMELKINELKQENERLNRNNLDYSKWREWDAKQVFYFIMSTVNDGSLNEYADNIKKEIFESEYTGKDLVDIENDDIRSMGIKKISVRKTVLKSIRRITQNKSQMNEGINAPTAYI